ncbi:MAG: hypothetical protein JST11_25955 [Acidobacteria bacterium]|nr:hypothetical protein [Acidobacteriota bacterium]
MTHLSEETLILHYYGEENDTPAPEGTLAVERHLEECGECRALYGSLVRTLNMVDALPVPERGEDYGARVWERIEPGLPARRRWLGFTLPPLRWAAAGVALAGLLVAAFFAGRFYPGTRPTPAITAKAPDAQGPERILLVAVGDYLERSQMVLVELANTTAKGPVDISAEQERAGDLVAETRLYRQTAAHTGDTRIDSVLEELERVLVDIKNQPSRMTPRALEELRQRLEAEGIIFKIRVLGANVRSRETTAAERAGSKL